jgi:hypothetical protein
MLRGEEWGWFAPNYKTLDDAWRVLLGTLEGVPGFEKNEQKMRMEIAAEGGGKGVVECWSLESDYPGRSRHYHGLVVDEAGLATQLLKNWHGDLRPTLARHAGVAWFFGTPLMRGDFVNLHALGQSGDPEWASWNKGMADNPYIRPSEIESQRRSMPPDDFRREVMGWPTDDGGNPFGYDAIVACVQKEPMDNPVVVWGWDVARSQDWTVGVGLDAMGNVVRIERWQDLPWGETIRKIVDATKQVPAWGDSTGVGDAIVERLVELGADVTPFVFSQKSKQSLMQRLAAAIQMREVTFPMGPLVTELESFTYKFTDTGTRYSAPSGLHDDCVMALALAIYGYDRVSPSVKAVALIPDGLIRDQNRWQEEMQVEDARVVTPEDTWQDHLGDGWGF